MQEAGISLLARWQNFYVIVGTAAATLTGLMFVATTLYAGARIPVRTARAGLETFATPVLEHFGAALLIATILSAPWQALWQPGLVLGVAGLGGVALVVIAMRWERLLTEYATKLSDWLWYMTLPLAAYVALVVAGVLLPRSPAPALFVIGAALVLLLLVGIRNAWDSVTFLAIERSRPEDRDQG
jgi:hypothetical protein